MARGCVRGFPALPIIEIETRVALGASLFAREISSRPSATPLTPRPPPPASARAADAQNLVKQYAFYMKRALVRLPATFARSRVAESGGIALASQISHPERHPDAHAPIRAPLAGR